MAKGILKSISLHFFILFFFLYGAELFKKNKRFEIFEIPLEVVDISDVTTNKLQNNENKKKSKVKSKKEFFDPPTPKSKPTPPEFAIKEKDIKNKKKEIKKSEEVKSTKNEKKRMESILKSIEKVKSENRQKIKKDDEDIKEEEIQEDEKEVKSLNLGEKLTISELDMIRKQFYDCWIVPAGAKNIKDLVVSIELKLDEDGNVVFSKLINDKNLKDSFFRAAAESAIRAVNHPDCKKLKVPKKKYDVWKSLILDFNPSIMFN